MLCSITELSNLTKSNLITESLCKKLNLKLEQVVINLSTVNKIVSNVSYTTKTNIKSKLNGYKSELKFSVLPTLTEKLPLIKFGKSQLNYPRNLFLADEEFNVPKEIHLLIGITTFYEVLGTKKIKLDNGPLFLYDTLFGWIFGGNLQLKNYSKNKKVSENSICNL